jgi:hypothetical protein
MKPSQGDENMTPDLGNSDPAKATLVLLEILKRGEKQIQDGKFRPATDVLKSLREPHKST